MEAVMEKVVLSEDVMVEFIEMLEAVREYQFAIGDRLNQLIQMHGGNKAGVINYLAGHLNVSASTLYDYSRTSERWTPYYRELYQSLDFTIYRNADPVEDKELLDKAIDNGWNATRFKRERYPAIVHPFNMLKRLMSWVSELIEKEDVFDEDKKELEKIKVTLEDLSQRYAQD